MILVLNFRGKNNRILYDVKLYEKIPKRKNKEKKLELSRVKSFQIVYVLVSHCERGIV